MQKTWVDPWIRKIPWKNGMATHSRILAWRIPMDRGAWQAIVHGVTKSQTWLTNTHTAYPWAFLVAQW